MIKETIVVEGRDDVTAVLAAVEANIVCTHGYGIKQETLNVIKTAYERTGIIIFTDPDHAGIKIREKLTGLFPDAKQAYLTKEQALRNADIGIENAKPEDIRRALAAASACRAAINSVLTIDDLQELGLFGGPGSSALRAGAGSLLGIGYANAKGFLKRLNYMGIDKNALAAAVDKIRSEENI